MNPPTIDHIGIIVADLERASATFERIIGAGPVHIREMADVGLRVAKFEAANVSIELIEYISDGPSFGREVMGDALGLNHISARIDDMDTALEGYAAAGFKVQPGFPRQGADGEVAFFERDAVTGLLLEVCRHEG